MPQTLTKQPAETRTFTLTFAPRLPDGVALTAISTTIQRVVAADGTKSTTTDLTFVSSSLTSPVVSLQISGGVDGVLYEVTVRCTADNGDLYEAEGLLAVCDI